MLRPISKNALKLVVVSLIQILAFFCLSVDLQELLDELRCLDVDFADTNFATDLE